VTLLDAEGRSATLLRVAGRIAEPPRHAQGAATLIVSAQRIVGRDQRRVYGRVRLRIQNASRSWSLGDAIVFRSTLRRIENFGNPGELDWAGWNARRDVWVGAYVWNDRDIVLLDAPLPVSPTVALRRAVALLARERGDEASALVAALSVGDRAGLGPETLARIRDAGLAHVLAISGLHMGLLAGFVLLVVRRVLVETSWVRRGHDAVAWAAAAAVVVLIAYAGVSGGGVSVLRAGAMGVAFLCMLARARARRSLDVLGTVAAVLCLRTPGFAGEAGFQLSFAAAGALLARGAPPRPPRGGLARLRAAATIALLAWAVTTPIVAYHFERVSVIAPLANLLAAPLVMATVILGCAAAALCSCWDAGARVVFAAACGAARPLLDLCRLLGGLDQAAVDVARPGPVLVCALSALPIALGLAQPRRRAWGTAICCTLALLSLTRAYHERWRTDRTDIHFAAVGQGDSTIVLLPGGSVAVVDVGRPGRGRLVVGPWLARLGVGRIDYLILTHAQADHFGGAAELLDRFEVGELWHNGGHCEVGAFAALVDRAAALGVRIVDVAGPSPTVREAAGGARLVALWPTDGGGACDANDRSIVVSVEYAERAVLLTGDIEAPAERRVAELLRRRGLRYDVLKAAHHGSATSSTPLLLDSARAWLAVASAGKGNRYGFPHPSVAARFAERGIPLLSTDRSGAISVRIDGGGLRVHAAKIL
jgi:competence protein ComEC